MIPALSSICHLHPLSSPWQSSTSRSCGTLHQRVTKLRYNRHRSNPFIPFAKPCWSVIAQLPWTSSRHGSLGPTRSWSKSMTNCTLHNITAVVRQSLCLSVIFVRSRHSSIKTYWVKLCFKWLHPCRSDHQVIFIQLHCLPIIKKHKGRLSTELNAADNLSHARHHKRTKTSDDNGTNLSSLQSQPSCSWPFPFFSRFSFELERWLWSLLVCRRSKWTNSSAKWQSPSQNYRDE